MSRNWTLVAGFTAAALSASTAPAHAATARPDAAPGMTVDGPGVRAGMVTAVSVVPATGRAEIVVRVDSSVTVADFTLAGPERIVIDMQGATLAMPPRFYDKVSRGGVTNVRFAQYKYDVVRVVIELDAARKYRVSREAGVIRVSLDGTAGAEFAAWHSGAMPSSPVADAAVPYDAPVAMNADAESDLASSTNIPRSAERPTRGITSQQQRQSTQPRITVTYQDADIRDVLAAFAAFSGRTIVVGREVAGTVTAEIRDQPWDIALQAILQAQGLAASEETSGIITVDSYQNIASKQASEPLVTQMISVNYASASTLVPTITSLLSRDCGGGGTAAAPVARAACVVRGNVVADTGTNTLLITEVPSRINDVLSYVRDLDVRTPQVAIKAKIIFVSRTDIEELGISYDLGSANAFFNRLVPRTNPATGLPYNGGTTPGVLQLGGDAIAGISNANRSFQGTSALNLVYSTMIGRFSLTSFIDALQEVRLADTQAEPNIVTLDNRRAEIVVGEETPIRVVDAGQGGGQARATVEFKETGIILSVTPHITNNRQILMTLHAEQSQLQAASADIGYTFLKRRADTQLLVSDGETAVIGGLTITQVTTSKAGIPFLIDLPVIGKLFGETRTQEAKQDLLILITPHIIDEGEAVRPRAN